MKERRRSPRLSINHDFRSVDQFVREYALNISAQGVFIRTTHVLPIGAPVDLRFSLIVDDLEVIEGTGTVIRSVAPGGDDAPGIGVLFDELSPDSHQALQRLFTQNVFDDAEQKVESVFSEVNALPHEPTAPRSPAD